MCQAGVGDSVLVNSRICSLLMAQRVATHVNFLGTIRFYVKTDTELRCKHGHTSVHSHIFASRCSAAASNGLVLDSRTIPGLKYQLLTATAND
jgi:hypothetical protein